MVSWGKFGAEKGHQGKSGVVRIQCGVQYVVMHLGGSALWQVPGCHKMLARGETVQCYVQSLHSLYNYNTSRNLKLS